MSHRLLLLFAVAAACGDGTHVATTDAPAADAPAAPVAAPDPRFKWVGAFPALSVLESFGGEAGMTIAASNELWMPANADTSEFEAYEVVPTVAVDSFSSAIDSPYGSDFSADFTTQTIITGLGFNATGVVVTYEGAPSPASNAGYELSGSAATGSDFAAYVAAEIGSGFVTTAIGYDGALFHLCAYADTASSAQYEATTLTGSAADVAAMAGALAQSGYIITAFGALDATTYGAVGTRVAGTAASYDARVIPDLGSGSGVGVDQVPPPYLGSGYAIVGSYTVAEPFNVWWIIER